MTIEAIYYVTLSKVHFMKGIISHNFLEKKMKFRESERLPRAHSWEIAKPFCKSLST